MAYLSGVESGHPSVTLRPDDQVLVFKIHSIGTIQLFILSYWCKRQTYPSPGKPSDPIAELDVEMVDFDVVPGAREKSVALSVLFFSKFGSFHWFKRDCWLVEFCEQFNTEHEFGNSRKLSQMPKQQKNKKINMKFVLNHFFYLSHRYVREWILKRIDWIVLASQIIACRWSHTTVRWDIGNTNASADSDITITAHILNII